MRWRLPPGLEAFMAAHPLHPYTLAGSQPLDQALQDFQALCAETGYPLLGSVQRNWLLPTALGALRPTCLAPEMMIAGDCGSNHTATTGHTPPGRAPMLIVGFDPFLDFYPALVAENLNGQYIFASDLSLDLPSLRQQRFVTGMTLARLFDTPEFRQEVAEAVKPRLGSAARVGFPAVLGLQRPVEARRDLEAAWGCRCSSAKPAATPSPACACFAGAGHQQLGGQVYDGMRVTGAS
jgi:glycerol-3-phosphate dehydrogenase subunit B